MTNGSATAVVLLNLGGPDSLEAVEPFLYNLFNDPDIINFPLSFLFRKRLAKLISSKRAPKIQEQYKKIGGKSPILETTKAQASMLEKKLNRHFPAKVYIAMRYWKPFTTDAVAEISKDKPSRIILLPLYPHYSIATTGSSSNQWNRVVKTDPSVKNIPTFLVEKYPEHDLYIDSLIERVQQGLNRFPEYRRKDVIVLFSAHGTPVKLVKLGDPYSFHIKATVDAIVKKMNLQQKYRLCFQSKVGPQKWLTPSTPDTIVEVCKEGAKDILMVPVAFTSDHLETLFELGIEYRHLAGENGIRQYEVTEGLNKSEKFIDALESLVLDKLKESGS